MNDYNSQMLRLLNKILENMVTQKDLKRFATKDDLKIFANKNDVKKVENKVDKLGNKVDILGNKVGILGNKVDILENKVDRLDQKLDQHIDYTKGMGEVVFEASSDRVMRDEFKKEVNRIDRIEEHLDLEPLTAL